MKTLLIIDAGLGQRAPTWRKPAGCRAPKAHLELIDNPNDAELAIVLGTALPADSALNGKNVYLGDINRAVAIRSCSWEKRKTTLSPTLRQRR